MRPEIPILKVTYLILSNWLKVDYILVWSLKSKLLFLSGKCFYQEVHFCRLTCDTSLENFLKGSDLFFFLQSWSFQNSWKQRVLLRNHSKCFVWVAHTLLIIIVGYSNSSQKLWFFFPEALTRKSKTNAYMEHLLSNVKWPLL